MPALGRTQSLRLGRRLGRALRFFCVRVSVTSFAEDFLYFLLDSYVGCDTSRVADSWRIRSGIYQSDTSLTTEVNLALALAMSDKNVDFATVWAQENGMAERSGDGTTNLIQWIASCV